MRSKATDVRNKKIVSLFCSGKYKQKQTQTKNNKDKKMPEYRLGTQIDFYLCVYKPITAH